MKQANYFQLSVAKRILTYVIGTKDLGLTFSGSDITLSAMVDASYASHPDRRSHFGISLHLGANSGSFHSISKKFKIMVLSSTEAEYIGLFEAAKLIAWARQFLSDLGFPQMDPTTIYEDNMSTIHMVKNGNDKGKTKHLDVRYHYIRELLLDKQVDITHKSTSDMIADMLTKPLDRPTYTKLRTRLLGILHPA
jgi:hypothetical protein